MGVVRLAQKCKQMLGVGIVGEEQFAKQTSLFSRMGGSPPRARRVVVEARHAFPTTGEEHNQEIVSAALKLKGGRQAQEKTAKLESFQVV
ncbi:hypothetical protein E2320_017225, partial [Naja naja]